MFFRILLIYMLVISLLAIILTLYDKLAAKRGKRRISERTLLLVSAAGGSVAMLASMLIANHKTRHIKFMLGIPLIIAVQSVLIVLAAKAAGYGA